MTSSEAIEQPDATDQKGNRYYRRRLLARELLGRHKDLMRLTFELPQGVSLRSLGIDIGLGDFVRMKPYAEKDKEGIENPAGGRAYSPVLHPDTEGKFGFIIRAYGPDDGKVVGMSSLMRFMPIGTELLVTNHVEHIFWNERNRGYYCHERNIAENGDASHSLCLIAYGIGITEIAPVAMSELLDPAVKRVTILWANKTWSDAEWVWQGANGTADDMVRQFFSKQGSYGARLQVKHILSREQRPEATFHGRITADILDSAFLQTGAAKESLRFLAVGTVAMIDFTYGLLGELGLDVAKKDDWGGHNLLYRKVARASTPADRRLSPLMAAASGGASQKRPPDIADDKSGKRPKL